jgi:hypothetical protein
MRWSRIPLLCLLILVGIKLDAQNIPDFTDAVDPLELNTPEIWLQLDTVVQHRTAISLSGVVQEFARGEKLFIETYYQKSVHHKLLKLAEYTLPIDHLYGLVEGTGKTYYRISDGVCTVILEYANFNNQVDKSLLNKDCLL